ncbi:TPA: hypothetical protein ACYX6H_005529, partial [Klebsiella variicola]
YHRDTVIFEVINTFDKKRCYLWRARFRSWHRADNLNGVKVCFQRGEDVDLAGLLRTSKVTGADLWDTFKIFPQLKRKISADFPLDSPPL